MVILSSCVNVAVYVAPYSSPESCLIFAFFSLVTDVILYLTLFAVAGVIVNEYVSPAFTRMLFNVPTVLPLCVIVPTAPFSGISSLIVML